MGSIARAIVSPLSIIDKDLGRIALQVTAVVATFIPGGQPVAAVAALALATLYKPKGPKPEQTERAIKTALPPRVSAYGRVRLYGAYILFDTNADGYAVDAWAFHDGLIDGIERYYLGDHQVYLNGASFVLPDADDAFGDGDTIEIGVNLGTGTETAFSSVVARMAGIWGSDHRGDGVCTGFMISKPVKAKNFNKIYPQGGPDATPLSLVVRAQAVFDWRDPAQDVDDPSTWAWSENAALHTAHYYLVRMKKSWERHFLPAIDYWTAFADDCDVPMSLKGGGTEPRYRSCVSHKHTDAHKVVLGNLLAACDGFVAPRGDGALVPYSGRYIEPDPDDLIGPDNIVSFSWEDGIPDEDAINEIAVSYLSGDHDYTTVDATAWRDEGAISAAGESKATSLENQVPSHSQARRLTKRLIAKAMAPNRGTVTTTASGRKIRGKRYIPLLIPAGPGVAFYDGPAEITALTRNLATGGVTFSWIAADPNIDDWNPATEEGDPAPVGDRVAPEPLDAPVITLAVAEFGFDSGAGTQGVCLDLTVTGPDRDDLTWFARTRTVGAAVWGEREYTDIDPGATVQIVTEFVSADTTVEVEVAYQVGDGRVSPWSVAEEVDTSTAGIAPSPTTDVSASGGVGSITINWRNPNSANYSYTRSYYGATNVFGAATALTPDDVAGTLAVRSATFGSIAPGTYYVWTRAFSNTGVGSTPTIASGTVTVT